MFPSTKLLSGGFGLLFSMGPVWAWLGKDVHMCVEADREHAARAEQMSAPQEAQWGSKQAHE